jgi:predicted phage gp36 major capsid-like protein
MEREHKATAAVTSDPFDKMLSRLIGLPNGAHIKPVVVQAIDFYGNSTTYVVQTVRTDEDVTAFVTQVNAQGSARYILPQSVLTVLDRQRTAITTKIRRRHGRRIAEERKAAGIKPGFMKRK